MPIDTNQEDIFHARRGDRDALDRLLARLHTRLELIAHNEMGPGLRAKVHTSDLLQSAFLDVVRSVEDFEGETENQFIGWFGRILNHNIRDKVRYFEAQKRRSGDRETVSNLEDPNVSPSEGVRITDREIQLTEQTKRALAKLSPQHRKVLELRFSDGLTHKEIGEKLDRTPEAIRVMVCRARSALAMQIRRDSGGKAKI